MIGVVAVSRFHVAAELLLGDTVVREFFHSELENFMAWHGMVCTEERANRVCRKMLLLLKTMLAFSHLPRKIVNTFVCK